jgi:hypothetical protein
VAAAQSSDRRSRVTRSPNSKSPAAIGRNHSSGLRGVETPHRGEIDRQEDDDEAADAFSWTHSGADCIRDDSERHFATRVMCTATICHVPFGLAQTVVTR